MTRGKIKAAEVLENPVLRNLLHLLFTLIAGYGLFRLVLYVLDTSKLGTEWLETHPDSAFLIIILILVISILLIDIALCMARRHFGEQKYSAAELAISFISSKFHKQEFEALRPQKEITGQKTGTLFNTGTGPIPGMPGGTIPKAVSPGPQGYAQAEKITSKSAEVPKKQVTIQDKHELPVEKPPAIEKHPATIPVLKQEPGSNIVLTESLQVNVSQGKRLIKAFESVHCVNVIDFRPKVTKDNVKITVELLMGPSRWSTPIKDALVYEYDNIMVDLYGDCIESALVRFNVEKDWINRNSIQTVQFRQVINGSWDVMPTKKIGQDAKYMFFEAAVSILSGPCAVVGL